MRYSVENMLNAVSHLRKNLQLWQGLQESRRQNGDTGLEQDAKPDTIRWIVGKPVLQLGNDMRQKTRKGLFGGNLLQLLQEHYFDTADVDLSVAFLAQNLLFSLTPPLPYL